jgi:hypothetical protein
MTIGHDDDRHLLPVVGQRSQQTPLALRLAYPQRFVAAIELVEFEVHAVSLDADHSATAPIRSCATLGDSLPLPTTASRS